MKRIAVVEKFYDSFKNHFKDIDVVKLDTGIENCDFIVGERNTLNADICIHESLLPAFNINEPVKEAFLAGVKVSGVTIYTPKNNKILAQYPVLIGNTTHFDEFEGKINKLEQLLYPIVVDKVLKDEVFDFADFIGGCHREGCRGYGGCH